MGGGERDYRLGTADDLGGVALWGGLVVPEGRLQRTRQSYEQNRDESLLMLPGIALMECHVCGIRRVFRYDIWRHEYRGACGHTLPVVAHHPV